MAKATYAILHIPHSSRFIPAAYREQFILSDRALEMEKRRLTDSYVDEIFCIDQDEAAPVIFPVSRLLVEPERILDDRKEAMAKVGMGAIYTRRTDGSPLRRELSPLERKRLIYKYYLPHHRSVGEAVERALELPFGKALIIDCHSFPFSPLPCDPDQSPNRPDICIGTDPFHTPGWLLETLVESVERSGYSCEVNRPYSGTFVPDPYFRRSTSVFSIMLEVNRRLYMDEGTGRRRKGFRKIAEDIQDIVMDLIQAEDDLYENLVDRGTVMAYQDWDSGGPGAGAGRVSVCDYEGSYYILHDAGYDGPYIDLQDAIEESGITRNDEPTLEIVFLDRLL